jgi:hypothetical protein
MGISIIGGATAPAVKVLNKSQVFTTSGTWTAPAGVTYAHVVIRGGNGTNNGFYFASSEYGSNNGADGGATSAFGKTAVGGVGSRSSVGPVANSSSGGQAMSANSQPATLEFFEAVTPGTGYTITIGSGAGSFATVSWAA